MKTILLFIFFILSLISIGQEPTYKLYSDIWEETEYPKGRRSYKPIGERCFFYLSNEIKKKINIDSILFYLPQSFNEFRKDYNKSLVIEDKMLSKKCLSYSKNLSIEFKHDESWSGMECNSKICDISFSKIPSDKNLNKIIADSCFDTFFNSKSHMNLLLSEEYKKFGFGVYYVEEYFFICVRAIK
jgi:hypothetical protein